MLATVSALAAATVHAVEPVAPSDPLVEGQQILREKHCADCHAVSGDIAPKRSAPQLGRQAAWQDVMQLAGSWWNHSPAMGRAMLSQQIPRSTLTADEAGKLISYLFYLKLFDDPGDSARGKTLFQDKGCGTCHQLGGKGGTAGPRLDDLRGYASPLFLAQALWNHGPEMLARMRELGRERPVLEGEDVADLAALLNGGQSIGLPQAGSPRIGQQLFRDRGCAKCHAILGVGGDQAPDLATRSRLVTVSQMAGALWNHGPVMWGKMEAAGIPFPRLTDRDMADLLAYLSFVQYMSTDGDVARGAGVFAAKTCDRCHSAGAGGTKSGPDLAASPAAQTAFHWTAAIWNHAPAVEKALEHDRIEWPRFAGDEMRDLFAFIRSRSAAGR